LADICVKFASSTGTQTNNLISYKEVVSSLKKEYEKIDFNYIDNTSKGILVKVY